MKVKSKYFLWLSLCCLSCLQSNNVSSENILRESKKIIVTDIQKINSSNKGTMVGANRTSTYIKLLTGKKVGLVANQTSVIYKSLPNGEEQNRLKRPFTHLVDSLLNLKIDLIKVFAPEHGFRGTADAGETVKDGVDKKTGLPVISLYGKNKKPTNEQLQGIDIMVFDIQDVGVRFYTYISTLHYVMEACAENKIALIVLDRPNPNGFYIDGPVLEKTHSSFLGMHPVPLVHGMTIGEYAKMINGEKWLANELKCSLTIIPCEGYDRQKPYRISIPPSPNLPNDKAINLYPSLGLFEGTNINAGRGTESQFQRFGAPFLNPDKFNFTYTPKPNKGAKNPKHNGSLCYGKDLSKSPDLQKINLEWIIEAYQNCLNKKDFFKTRSFTLHAGTQKLQKQIEKGLPAEVIRKSWQADLVNFKEKRLKYLLYD